jgi:membrane protease YdiL (CAAX protease family)
MGYHPQAAPINHHQAPIQWLFRLPLRHIFTVAVVVFYAGLVILHSDIIGLTSFITAAITVWWMPDAQRKYLAILLAAVALMAINPVAPTLNPGRVAIIYPLMVAAVVVPYLLSHYFFRQHLVHFNFDWRRRWTRFEIGYIAYIAASAYLICPYYLTSTGAYLRWEHIPPTLGPTLASFSAITATGIWEEFFFIGVVYNILRRYMSFWWANTIQALLFTTFLYQMGFRYWAPAFLLVYAFGQGFMFERTKSLLYVLVVHVFADTLIFLSLMDAYFPHLAPYFITAR